jgi:hypothetical protein
VVDYFFAQQLAVLFVYEQSVVPFFGQLLIKEQSAVPFSG